MSMVKSMTGYGADTFSIDGTDITIEVRSVNSRYLDFITKMPRSFHMYESEIKQLIQQSLYRGRIEVYITVTGKGLTNKSMVANWELMDEYIEVLKKINSRYEMDNEITLSMFVNHNDFISIIEEDTLTTSLKDKLLNSLHTAIKQVVAARRSEGTFLHKDMKERVTNLKNMLLLIEERQKVMHTQYKARIQERIEASIEKDIQLDQGAFIQEIALLAEKGDIAEEITRLNSHIEHFHQILNNQYEEPIGRKLDFITQEMHREINTIGSKSVDTQLSEFVVSVKSDIEKIKEQVQNVE